MAFIRLDPRRVTTKEQADELTGRLTSLQRTGGGGDQWYTIDKETLLVSTSNGKNLAEVKDFALTQPEVYEFEWSSNTFRREGDLPYNDLRESLGMSVPTPPKPPAKGKSKKTKKSKGKKKAKAEKEEL